MLCEHPRLTDEGRCQDCDRRIPIESSAQKKRRERAKRTLDHFVARWLKFKHPEIKDQKYKTLWAALRVISLFEKRKTKPWNP